MRLVASAFLATFLSAQETGDDVPSILSVSADSLAKQQRDERSRLFNLDMGVALPLDDPSPKFLPLVNSIVDFPAMPELPLSETDTVIVGRVTIVQPYLSEDRKAMYTEYIVHVDQIIKAVAQYVGKDDSLTIVRVGGVARMPNGRIARHTISGYEPIAVGQQYLMFLMYDPPATAFRTTKLWLIKSGMLDAMSPADLVRVRRGTSQVHGQKIEDVLLSLAR